MASYLHRVADDELATRLAAIGAVLIEGPKACGKTVTASQIARTMIRLDEDANARAAVSLAPQVLFDQPTPILFDEWQVQPEIWNRIRRQVDDRGDAGLYILTGSATPNDDVSRHSGAGRFGTIRMRPMSLYETGHSTGGISLRALFDGDQPVAPDPQLTVPELFERIVIGGWPGLIGASVESAQAWLKDYLHQVVEVDVPGLGTRRDPANVHRLIESLARAVGQPAKQAELAKDVGGDSGPVASETITAYLDALDRLMLLDNSPAFRTHLRSRTRLRTAPVRYLVDPSLAAAALDIGPKELFADLNAAGFHFESLAVRDLRIYAQPLRGRVESWRDANGREIDAVISVAGGKWGAFEVKLNPDDVDGAATALRKFASDVDTSMVAEPSVLGVITSTGYAYPRPDGVQVIPIGALGP